MYRSLALPITLLLCFYARVCRGDQFYGSEVNDDLFLGDDDNLLSSLVGDDDLLLSTFLGDDDMIHLGNLFGIDPDLTEKETLCMDETTKFVQNSKALQDTMFAYLIISMDFPSDDDEDQDVNDITITYPQEAVDSYNAVCGEVGGVLLVIKEGTYDCTMDEEDSCQLTIQNMAQCVASVEDHEGFPQGKLLVQTMDQLGLECKIGNGRRTTTLLWRRRRSVSLLRQRSPSPSSWQWWGACS